MGKNVLPHLFGTRWKNAYNWFYVFTIVLASVASIDIAVNFVDSAYALMVIPTMISSFLLAPKVMKEAKRYFSTL
jgi:Na+/alanine symporter